MQPSDVPGTYSYKAYNSSGVLAVSGTMTLAVVDSGSVSGTWTFVAVLRSERVGPQTGTGRLAGVVEKSSVSINLNPDWKDNNVFLLGTLSPDRIAGRWMWSTFSGPTAEGTFEATRVLTTYSTDI